LSREVNRVVTGSDASRKTNLQFILTSDEFWFFDYTPNSRIWLSPDAETPEVARQLIKTSTVMVKVFWNPTSLYTNRFLESGTSFNSTYFTEYVLSDI
jgi:hypothetical protein